MRPLPQRAEVVIVGGGFAGAATAYELGRAGISDVLMLEREDTCGYHASGRNAALGRQLVEDEISTDLTLSGAEFLRDPPRGFTSTPLLHPTGSVILSNSEPFLAALMKRASRRELPVESIAPARLSERWPCLVGVETAGGVLFETDGVIDIHALLQGYLAGARHSGVQIEVKCNVVGFRSGEPVVVMTDRGEVEARCVVIAGGAWSSQLGGLASSSPLPLRPMQRRLFLTEKAAELASGDADPFLWRVGEGEFYARREGGGYLLSGCDENEVEPCDAQVMPNAVSDLADKLARVAPRFAELGIARSWACLRTFAPNRQPVIDWDSGVPWLFWVAGLGGHGATASPAIGQSAAAKIAVRIAPRLALSNSS